MHRHRRVVVVGGGVSGLATAHYLSAAGADLEVVLVEGTGRLGGKVRTERVGGLPVDTGPDALLVRLPAMRDLLGDLGLAGAVVGPGAQGAFVWSRGRLRPLPPSTLFGVPERLLPLLRSGLLSPAGIARAALDLVLPRAALGDDPSVGELVRGRLGSQVFDRLVDPLLGGVHAGRADLLSARSTVPEVAALARDHRSLTLGSRQRAHQPAPAGPALVTLDGGLTRLVDALVATLDAGAVRLDEPVSAVLRDGTGYLVLRDGADDLIADAVVLATPAHATARLLADLAPDAAAAAGGVPYADVASLTLRYPLAAMGRDLDGTGFLVPPEEGLLLVGCSWLPAKWPQLADPGSVLVRAMVGRHGDTRFTAMDDDELSRRVHAELVATMGLTGTAVEARVQRWPLAMPQYTVGHQARLDRIDRALEPLPGLKVTGAGYRGVGIASCVSQAKRTAAELLAVLTADAVDVEPTLGRRA